MPASEFLTFPVLGGVLFLLWAIAARRAPLDAGIIAAAGLLLLLAGLREQLDSVSERRLGLWPELALGLLGAAMLVRSFRSPLSPPHRTGLRLAGFAATLPLLLLIALIALFSWGADHDYHRPPATNEAQVNSS